MVYKLSTNEFLARLEHLHDNITRMFTVPGFGQIGRNSLVIKVIFLCSWAGANGKDPLNCQLNLRYWVVLEFIFSVPG